MDEDILKAKEIEFNNGCICGGCAVGFIAIIGGIILIVSETSLAAGIGSGIFGIMILIFSGVYSHCNSNDKIDVSTGYTYYCYDISNQSVRMCVIQREGKQLISTPYECNLGHINDIDFIDYDDSGSGASNLRVRKQKTKGFFESRYHHTQMYSFGPKKAFGELLTKRINDIKNAGLNHVQLLYNQHVSNINADNRKFSQIEGLNSSPYNPNYGGSNADVYVPLSEHN